MNEAETRAELIDPLLAAAGWGVVEGLSGGGLEQLLKACLLAASPGIENVGRFASGRSTPSTREVAADQRSCGNH
ncbi:hypothetical protein KBY96_09405 [Cyanobium sp. ATX 6A2]|uniref:hypothetical protein n=1 Tax=Cyanobium sp. ATX 6A2 TaxID=2823700 RepID=UPI0020CC9A55|nr:hypothetical protein [Cyanobium sp. ATX 6A2]MCP9888140.1 hypothetical protein [Cyanobium sp. ATX 6A2]